VLSGIARPAVPLGQAEAVGQMVGLILCMIFYISFKILENMYTLLKYIENGIKLGKYKINFLRILLLDLCHRLDQILF
jgi:hypothetical protein